MKTKLLLAVYFVLIAQAAQSADILRQHWNSNTEWEVASGSSGNKSYISKFGEAPDIDIADGFETLWDGGGTYVPPTAARTHQVASTLAADAGNELSSGTCTGDGANDGSNIIDSTATFITDTVAIGDYVLNDSDVTIGKITAVTSETVLTIDHMANPGSLIGEGINHKGESYRVVESSSTGAGVIHIQGLNSTLENSISEFVITNGVTNVATANDYKRIFRARTFVSGSGNEAAGIITITADTDATVTAQIINGNNQTMMCIYTVPVGKTGYLMSWRANLSRRGNAISNVILRVGDLLGVNYITDRAAILGSGSSSYVHNFPHPLTIAGGVDIFIEADSSANDAGVACGFEMLLFDQR